MCVRRPHPEEPVPGADRAAEEAGGAEDLLHGVLRGPEGVHLETSRTQTPAGATGTPSPLAHL